MFTEFKGFIEQLVRRYDKIGRYTEDLVSDINLKLISSNFLETFRKWHFAHLPEKIKGEDIPALLGITWEQWYSQQWYRIKGMDKYKEGYWESKYWAKRSPRAVLVAPIPLQGTGLRKSDVYYTEEVLETAACWKRRTNAPLVVRRAKFENYLRVSVKNYFKNCLRGIGRHNQDIYLPPNEDGGAWEHDVEEHQDTCKEEILALLHAHKKLGEHLPKVLQLLDNKVPLDTALAQLKLGITIHDLRRTLSS